ncbi:MAG: branched-chain amino acid ABC transporter permease [Betaproteobacteria bacterium]|nr:branched-chain amino acid ABC transporter permease [Betaproteobacteria bacterium]
MTNVHWPLDSGRAAFLKGCKDALGVPAAVLFAGMMGFGALCHSVGLSAWAAAGTTIFMFALPGQVVFAEMVATGASGLVIGVAAMLTATRFMPMTLALLPQIPLNRRGRWLYGAVHFLSMTSWAIAMRDFPKLDPVHRGPYFAGLGLVCWLCSIPGTVLGYLLAGEVPLPITLALVFLNPLFFLLSFTEVRPRANRLAIGLGAAIGPLTYLAAPNASLFSAGLIGGSLAYLLNRLMRS